MMPALRHGTSAAEIQVPSTSITEPTIARQRDFKDRTCGGKDRACSGAAHFLARSQNVLRVQIGSPI